MGGHHFISYSRPEASDFVTVLCDEIEASSPDFRVWFDQRDGRPGEDWDEQIAEAIRTCESLVFVMTEDSVAPTSVCKQEWTYALQCKRPLTLLKRDAKAGLPFQLLNRQYIDFTGSFSQALAQLRMHLRWLVSPEGRLRELEFRLQDARRDLIRAANDQQKARIQAEISLLDEEIARQRERVEHPEAAAQRARESIERGIEMERQPAKPAVGAVHTKFINPPPARAPSYFQDRHVETKLIGTFLKDDTVRLISVVGRGGTGKTAMVCRLLKSLEGGQLPDDGGPLSVDGIVYISRSGSRPVNLPNIYTDLVKLLPDDRAARLEGLYKDPQAATVAKMRVLLEAFPSGRTVLLLDNFEDVVDPETLNMTDPELEEGLRAFLELPEHGVKVIVTTRLAPRSLALVAPGQQRRLDLDEGLSSPYAEQILRAMDADGTLGLKTADAALLNEARIRTRGYPRALEALFAILSADRDTSLPDLLEQAERRNLLPENVVHDLVGEAFSRLDPAAQQVMQALAVFARPVPPTAVDHLLQPYIPGMGSAPVLNRLVNMKFARGESGRYHLHPVDLEYALSQLPEGAEADRSAQPPPFTRFALYHQAAEYFEQTRLPRSEWKTIDDLAPQLAEFDLRCEAHDWDSAAWVLLGIAHEYLHVWGFIRLSAQLHERLADRLVDADLDQAIMGSLGQAYYRMGRYQEALTATEQALATARQIEDRQAEASHVNSLGLVYDNLGQQPKAIEYYQQALAIARDLSNRQDEGIYLGNLGTVFADLGEESRAIEYYQQALTIARETEDRRSECTHLGNLGLCYHSQGDIARAVAYYGQSLALARDLGYRLIEDQNLAALAESHAIVGAFERSIEYYQQALVISREIEYRRMESATLNVLAEVQACMGLVDEATDPCSQALAIAREMGDPRQEGFALASLAQILCDKGHYQEAASAALEAARIGEKISNVGISSSAHGAVALARLLSRDLPGARSAAEAARRYRSPNNDDNVLVLLGVVAMRQGDTTAAREAFTQALAKTADLLSHCAQNYDAFDNRALALCGLALCDGTDQMQEASEAYRSARAITAAPGVVGQTLRLLDALAVGDRTGVLGTVRPAAAGDTVTKPGELEAMKDFFISYNKADKNWAEWIAWTLEEAGYSVVIQAWDFRPGGNFVLEMQKAATGTHKTIAVLSDNYLKAEYTHPEWAAAFARDPQGQERTLIPMRVQECTPRGLLGPIQYVDLVALSEQDARVAILGAFSGRAKPSQAPAFPGASGGATPPIPQRVAPEPVHYPGISAGGNVTDSIIVTGSGNTISTAPVQPRLTPLPGASFSSTERLGLMQQLNALSAQQLNMLIFALNPPSGLIPPMPAAQGDRTFALLSWAEGPGGGGVLQIQQVLDAILHPQ